MQTRKDTNPCPKVHMRKLAPMQLVPLFVAYTLLSLVVPISVSSQEYSVLWGEDGESWDPENSVLRDYTDVGYMSGDLPIPDWPIGVNVTDYGAIPDDGVDDTQAFINAIAACPPNEAVFVPVGRYQITDQIRIDRNYVVLRGEDMYRSILFFPKNMGERYPQSDFGSSLAKGAFLHLGGGTHKSIENLTIEFREQMKMGHWEWRGAYGIRIGGDIEDSWIRNVRIKNADEAIKFGGAERISVVNVVFDHWHGRPSFKGSGGVIGFVGHAGIRMTDVRKSLIHNVEFKGITHHDLDLINYPKDNVVSRVKLHGKGFGYHGGGAERNLYTDITATRPKSPPNNMQSSEIYWGYWTPGALAPEAIEGALDTTHTYVGIDSAYPTTINSTFHYEKITPGELSPRNIYLAQMAEREKLDNLYLEPLPTPPLPPELRGDVRIVHASESAGGGVGGFTKFDLTHLEDIDAIAKVRLKVCFARIKNPDRTFNMHVAPVADDAWSNGSLPAASAVGDILDSVPIESPKRHEWVEFDVTPFVQTEWLGDQIVSLKLSTSGAGGYLGNLHGQASGNAPHLVIERVPDPVPGAPAAPTGLETISQNGYIVLDWDDAPESDFASYRIRRLPDSNASHPIAEGLVISDFADISAEVNRAITEMPEDVIFRYTVTAVDQHGYESLPSRVTYGSVLSADGSNQPPAFASEMLILPNAIEGRPYTADLANFVTDSEEDPLYFSNISGPDWLSIDADGNLSGTPAPSDVGSVEFFVQVNAVGGRDKATIQFSVHSSAPVDSDGDGIDDAWEITHFEAIESIDGTIDSDGDRLLDFFEFLFNRDPNNPSDGIAPLSADRIEGGNGIIFRWTVGPGMVEGTHYHVRYSTDLSRWDPLPAGATLESIPGNPTQVELTLPADVGDQAFVMLTGPMP